MKNLLNKNLFLFIFLCTLFLEFSNCLSNLSLIELKKELSALREERQKLENTFESTQKLKCRL